MQITVKSSYFKVLKRLLTANVDINAAAATDSYDKTVLQATAVREYIKIIKKLLMINADVNAADNFFD